MAQLGGTPITLLPGEMQLSRGESLEDTAQVLSRYVDALAIRTLSHDELEAWAEACTIPVINALTEVEHPCQALADAMTIRERLGALRRRPHRVGRRRHERARLAGAPRARASAWTCRRVPRGLRAAGGNAARADRATRARPPAAPTCSSPTSGSRSARRRRAASACATWSRTASTTSLLALANPEAIVLHCLPAHPGEEITPEVLYGPSSRRCGTRRRTACTRRRRCSRCCSARDPRRR